MQGKEAAGVLRRICKDLNCTVDDVVEAMQLQERVKGSALRLFESYGAGPNDTLEIIVSRAPAGDPDVAFLSTLIEDDLN